jgi:hypothetical protein
MALTNPSALELKLLLELDFLLRRNLEAYTTYYQPVFRQEDVIRLAPVA